MYMCLTKTKCDFFGRLKNRPHDGYKQIAFILRPLAGKRISQIQILRRIEVNAPSEKCKRSVSNKLVCWKSDQEHEYSFALCELN
jgi:hypothetical protein